MTMVRIHKKVLIIVIIILFTCSVVLNICCFKENKKFKNQYESMVCVTNQFDKTNLISFVVLENNLVQRDINIEIFDIKKGEVMQSVPLNQSIQREIEEYLRNITGLYIKAKPIPNEGFVIRVPLRPPQKVKNILPNDKGIDIINEVFILFPKQRDPFLLILDKKQRPFFYNFNGNTNILLEKLNFRR